MKKVRYPKSKVELDAMSKQEIEDHRIDYLRQDVVPQIESRRYFDELEVYLMIRFKDVYLARYDRWVRESKTADGIDPNYDDATRLVASIIERMGKENFYHLGLMDRQKELGEMQYVK